MPIASRIASDARPRLAKLSHNDAAALHMSWNYIVFGSADLPQRHRNR
ncbi:hypothetical protein [Sphingomonas sp.]